MVVLIMKGSVIMKKLISIILVIFILVSCAATAGAEVILSEVLSAETFTA